MLHRRVQGFAFDRGHNHVLLVLMRSDAQGELLGGVGGKVRFGESFGQAMSRVALEVIGDRMGELSWVLYGRHRGVGWEDWLFYAEADVSFGEQLEQLERVGGGDRFVVVPREGLVHWPTDESVQYCVPMAYAHSRGTDKTRFVDVEERERGRG